MMRLFVVLLLLFPIVAFSAQDSSDDEAFENEIRAKIEKEKLERLKGWNRLVFRCSVPVNANPKEMFDRICSRTATNMKFLAASANTQTQVAVNAHNLGFLSALGGMLRLEVDLFATSCETGACAIHASVSATFPYDKAVDQAARSYPVLDKDKGGPKDSPASVPRPIVALLWGPRELTASGYAGEELTSAVANGLDAFLKEFFTDYLNANRK